MRQAPIVQHVYVGFNQRQRRFASPLVRRAFDYAVNRRAIIDAVLKGHGDHPVESRLWTAVLTEYWARLFVDDRVAVAAADHETALSG